MSVVRKSRLAVFCACVVELGEYVAMEGVCVFPSLHCNVVAVDWVGVMRGKMQSFCTCKGG